MSTSTPPFPPKLLTASRLERVRYADRIVVGHPKLTAAYEQIWRYLTYGKPGQIITVYGPTGAGKSTLSARITRELLKAAFKAMVKDLTYIPVISVEAAKNGRPFDWKDFYSRFLEAAWEPQVDEKMDVKAKIHRKPIGAGPPPGGSCAYLRRVLERCLKERRVRVALIDEAGHLARHAIGPRAQMDCVKSFASLSETITLLVGTYDVLHLSKKSAQLSRRTQRIHLGRYHADRSEDLQAFHNTVFTLLQRLPLHEPPQLLQMSDFLYERSAGCIGILKEWVVRAMALAVHENRPTILPKDLHETAKPADEMQNIIDEILQGEQILREEEAVSGDTLRQMLSFPGYSTPTSATPAQSEAVLPKKPRQRRLPGQRKPSRDPVGMPTTASVSVT
ncbi:ATP-binding protein [Nitrospira sp. Nam74]